MAGLFFKRQDTPEGKYLVTRRDGSVPDWLYFVIGSRDPAAPAALRAYADKGEELGYDPVFVSDMRDLADQFQRDLDANGPGDPDAPPHRTDDPATIEKMRGARGA